MPDVPGTEVNRDPSFDALLEAQVAEAEERLQQCSNGESVCHYTRAGVAVPALKDAEGRWAALRQVQQSLRSGLPSAAAFSTVVDQWTEDLARRRSKGAGPDWISYRAGGLDALEQLSDQLSLGTG